MYCYLLFCLHLLVNPAGASISYAIPISFNTDSIPAKEVDSSKEDIFTFVEHPPTFPGGEAVLSRYLQENIKYPNIAIVEGIHGTCFVNFIIDPNGSVRNAKIIGATHPYLDPEAMRVVMAMPKWNPGYQNGKAVAVFYNLPIRFTYGQTPSGFKKNTAGRYYEKMEPVISIKGLTTDARATDTAYFPGDHPAAYPGGKGDLYRFMKNNLTYPYKARRKKISAAVSATFVIDRNGLVTDIKMENPPVEFIDEEVIRVIGLMPDWTARVEQGKFATQRFKLAITFMMEP